MAINNYLTQDSQRNYQGRTSRRGFLKAGIAGLGAIVAGASTPIYSTEPTPRVPSYEEYCRAYIDIFGSDEFEINKGDIKQEWETSDPMKKSAIYDYTKYVKVYVKTFGEKEFKKNRNKLIEKWMHESPRRRQKSQEYLADFSNMKVPPYEDFKKVLGNRCDPKNEESTRKFWENQDDKSKKIVYLVYTRPEQVSSFYFHETEEDKVRKLGLTDKEAQDYETAFEQFGFWKVRLNKGDFSSNLIYELFSKRELK